MFTLKSGSMLRSAVPVFSLRAAEARGSDLARKRDKATALMEGITGGWGFFLKV